MSTARIGVVGAGIVGLAVARRLQQAMHVEVTVIDKERTVAAHQTGHNSNVVHSGVYYPPGSLKATLCRRGGELLRAYCAEHGSRTRRSARSSSRFATTSCPAFSTWPIGRRPTAFPDHG